MINDNIKAEYNFFVNDIINNFIKRHESDELTVNDLGNFIINEIRETYNISNQDKIKKGKYEALKIEHINLQNKYNKLNKTFKNRGRYIIKNHLGLGLYNAYKQFLE